jgi:NADH dehydrogenase FAD-containing subunit
MTKLLHKVIIVGGGVAGVRCALQLAEYNLPNTKIILVADKPHFEYHAALYRLVTGSSPLEVCIPLREIFFGKNVEVIEDRITELHRGEQVIVGSSGSHYHYVWDEVNH